MDLLAKNAARTAEIIEWINDEASNMAYEVKWEGKVIEKGIRKFCGVKNSVENIVSWSLNKSAFDLSHNLGTIYSWHIT